MTAMRTRQKWNTSLQLSLRARAPGRAWNVPSGGDTAEAERLWAAWLETPRDHLTDRFARLLARNQTLAGEVRQFALD